MPNSLPPLSLCTHEPVLTPERKVWRAVLGQAYADAESPPFSDGSEEAMERTIARRFLRADSVDEKEILEIVCGFADVPADRVILWARRRYPLEQAIEKHVECGSPAPAFSTPVTAEP
jgi:hypothetical protein